MMQDLCLCYVLGPHIRENVQSTSFLVSKGKWRSPNFHVCYKKYDRLAFFYEFNKVNFEVLTKLAHIVITENFCEAHCDSLADIYIHIIII